MGKNLERIQRRAVDLVKILRGTSDPNAIPDRACALCWWYDASAGYTEVLMNATPETQLLIQCQLDGDEVDMGDCCPAYKSFLDRGDCHDASAHEKAAALELKLSSQHLPVSS